MTNKDKESKRFILTVCGNKSWKMKELIAESIDPEHCDINPIKSRTHKTSAYHSVGFSFHFVNKEDYLFFKILSDGLVA